VRLKILGKVWELRFVPRVERGARGACDPPDKPGKQIIVRDKLRGEERLEVLVHEMVHAAGWHLDEDYVERFARDVARALWRLGYRGQR